MLLYPHLHFPVRVRQEPALGQNVLIKPLVPDAASAGLTDAPVGGDKASASPPLRPQLDAIVPAPVQVTTPSSSIIFVLDILTATLPLGYIIPASYNMP